MKKKLPFDLSSATLHVLAMLFMLLDHTWARLLPSQEWMTCVGRLAFPIFAFMIVEGVHHTRNLGRYMRRMLVFALLSEIPFDLMYASTPFYPYHQNVLWTFLIALCGIWMMEKVKKKGKLPLTIAADFGIVLLTSLLALVGMTDYNIAGVLTVYVFYFFHGRRWWCFVGQFLLLWYLNVEILGGLCYNVELFGQTMEIVQQGLALLALPIIWLYQGRKGTHSKAFQYFCYGFYPVHGLLIWLIGALT